MKKNKKVASMLYSVAVLGTLLSPSVLNSASVVLAESIEEVGEVTTTIPEVATEDKVDNNIVKDLVEDTKQPTPESVKGTETSTETGTVEKSTDIVDEEENNQGQHKYVINYVSVDEYGNNPQLINTIKIDSNSLPELKMVYVGPDGNIYYWSSTSTKKINDNLSEGTIKYYRKRPDHFIYYKLSPEDEALAYPEGKPASPYNLEGSDEFDKPDGLEVPSESRENVPRPEPGGPGGNINPIDESIYITAFLDEDYSVEEPLRESHHGPQFIDPVDIPNYKFVRSENTESVLPGSYRLVHYYHHIKTQHIKVVDGTETVLETEEGAKEKKEFENLVYYETKTLENGDILHYYKPTPPEKLYHTFFVDTETNANIADFELGDILPKIFPDYNFIRTEKFLRDDEVSDILHYYYHIKTKHVLQRDGEEDKVLKTEFGKKGRDAFDDVIFVRSEVKENGDTVHYYTPVTKNKTIHFDKENNKVLEEVDTKEGKKEFENYVFVNTDEDVTKNYLTTTRHNYHLLKTTHVLQKEGEQDKVLKEEVGKKDKSAFDDVIFVRSEVKENGDTVHYYTPVTKNKTIHFDKENNKVLEEVDTKEGKKEFENYVFVNTEDLGTKNYLTTTRHNYHLLKTTHVLQKEGEKDKVLKEEVGKKDKSTFDDVIFVHSEVKENGDTVHYYTPVTKNKTIHFDKENNKVLEEVDTKEGKKEFDNYVFVNTDEDVTKNYLTTTRHNYHLLKTTHILQKEGEKDKVLKGEIGKKDKSTFDDVVYVRSEVKENGDTVHYYTPVTKNKTIHFDKENNKVLEEVDTKEGKKEFENYVFVNTDEDVTKNYLTTTRHNYHLLKTTHVLQKEGKQDRVLKEEVGKKDKQDFSGLTFVKSETLENGDTIHYYKEVETYLPPAPIVPEATTPETVPVEKKKDKEPQPEPTPEVTKETPKENTPEPTKPTTKKVVPLETGVNAEGDLLPVWVITILSGVLGLAWFSKKDNKKEK